MGGTLLPGSPGGWFIYKTVLRTRHSRQWDFLFTVSLVEGKGINSSSTWHFIDLLPILLLKNLSRGPQTSYCSPIFFSECVWAGEEGSFRLFYLQRLLEVRIHRFQEASDWIICMIYAEVHNSPRSWMTGTQQDPVEGEDSGVPGEHLTGMQRSGADAE